MGLRRTTPVKFSPMGLSDALDSSNVFKGAMQRLQNLIPDPTTRNVWTCRPASIRQTSFAGFTAPGFISAEFIIGTKVYGMIASGLNAGHDQPFCYDLGTGAFIGISGVTNLNTPVSPATTGNWTPPTMDLVGANLIVTHPGFSGAGGVYFGWFDLTNPAAPVWNGGDLATHPISFVPSSVRQFNGRAYFIANVVAQPAVFFSDALTLTATNANQILTFGDNVPLTALGALPLDNQLGGIIQALIVFKGLSNMYQITGDPTTSNLSVNSLNVATGTLAQNSVCPTSKGLAFVSADGVRIIDFTAHVSDPLGTAGMGITVPLIFATNPSRIAMACNASYLRVSVLNGSLAVPTNEEYWYDIPRQCWSGPHTFPAALIQPYSNTFIMVATGVNAGLWQSDVVQYATSTFVENGAQMRMAWIPSMLPDTEQMSENAIVELTINMLLNTSGPDYTVTAYNSDGATLDTVTIPPQPLGAVFGTATFGVSVFSSANTNLVPMQVNWHYPIVFRKLAVGVVGNCFSGFKIGDMFMRYEMLGYLQQTAYGQ